MAGGVGKGKEGFQQACLSTPSSPLSPSGPGQGGMEAGCCSQQNCHFHQMSRGLFARLQPLCPVLVAVYKALTAAEHRRGSRGPEGRPCLLSPSATPNIKHTPRHQPTGFASLSPQTMVSPLSGEDLTTAASRCAGGETLRPTAFCSPLPSHRASHHSTYWLGMACYSR